MRNGEIMNTPRQAEESAAMTAIEFLSCRFSFKIDDYNYREAQTQMM
jgi:hypothetical protein